MSAPSTDRVQSRMHDMRIRVEYTKAEHPRFSPWEIGRILDLHEDTVRYILDHLGELP